MTAVGFEPTPLWTGALSQRLRPLGQTALEGLKASSLSTLGCAPPSSRAAVRACAKAAHSARLGPLGLETPAHGNATACSYSNGLFAEARARDCRAEMADSRGGQLGA